MSKPLLTLVRVFAAALAVLPLAGAARAGVLIGQLPTKGGADVRELRWTFEGDSVRFVLVAAGPDGKLTEHRLDSVPVNAVRMALRYAVDGRPLTVTMIKADPLSDLKILLHPVLIDTPLGRRAIRLDQLVDQFAGSRELPQRVILRTFVHDEHSLYQLAWAAQAKPLLEWRRTNLGGVKKEEERLALQKDLDTLTKRVDSYLADDALRRRAAGALKELGKAKGGRSLLRAKPEYYDSDLVGALLGPDAKAELDTALRVVTAPVTSALDDIRKVERLAKQFNMDAAAFKQKDEELAAAIDAFRRKEFPDPDERRTLLKRAEELKEEQAELKNRAEALTLDEKRANEVIGRWMRKAVSLPPEFTDWSGVREREFAGDVTDYLAPERPEQQFRFMVQVAFTSPPQFLKGKAAAAEEYADENPYEFTEIEEQVNALVTGGLKADPEAAAAVREMAAFLRLQRLFRAAIAGKIGERFPESRLVDLATDLGPGDPAFEYARTPRWLPRPGAVEFAGMVAIVTASGVSQKDLASITNSLQTDRQVRARLREVALPRLEALAKSPSEVDRTAATVLQNCLLLLDEALARRDALGQHLRRVPTPDTRAYVATAFVPGTLLPPPAFYTVVRARMWDDYEADLAQWLVRWEKEATALAAGPKTSVVIRKAVGAVAGTDYAIQARLRMRVLDDERFIDLQRRGEQ